MFRRISIHSAAYYQTAKNSFPGFSTFSVRGDQIWKQTQKLHFVGWARNFLSPTLLTWERAEGVPINTWYISRIGSRVWKVDCACFRHISTSGFREKWHFQCFSAIMHCVDQREGGNTVLCHRKARRRTMDDRMTCWYPCKHRFAW